jgi:DNA-binding MarR family transcriptional regulator
MSNAPSAGDETRHLLRALSRLIRELTRITGGPEDGPAMTNMQRLALFELALEGPRRLSDLASRMGTTASTASRAVDALVELELVERVVDPHDRRALQIDVTSRGRARADERESLVAAAFQPAVAGLSAREREQISRLLEKLTTSLEPPRS